MHNKTFIFDRYEIHENTGELSFFYAYELNGEKLVEFTEKLTLPEKHISKTIPDHLLQALHLILGISYYKLYCPKEIRIENYSLTQDQASFWNIVYTKGLGEFFYKNKIDFRNHVNFPSNSKATESMAQQLDNIEEKALVSIGGGKDSIISLEYTRETGIPFELFSLNDYEIIQDVAHVAGKTTCVITRKVDPLLLEFNQKSDTFNGHIPISAIYAFTSLLYAYLNEYKYIVYSNERSSNYGNAEYLGQEVSHQWSKSQEFEDLFREYVKKNIVEGIEYFSYLRPLYELHIAKLFASYPQYFSVFSSSNHNFRIHKEGNKRWDYTSPKTAFVFSLLAAFLPKENMLDIFGENLYSFENLQEIYRELLGLKNIKPFDCVGTPEEVQVAFFMSHKKGHYSEDIVMKMFEKEILPSIENRIEQLKDEVFSYGNDKNIPGPFLHVLKKHIS